MKHRSLAHSHCKIKALQSHASTKKTNATGFGRISQQLRRYIPRISFTDRSIFSLCFELSILKLGEYVLVLSGNSFWKAVSVPAGM